MLKVLIATENFYFTKKILNIALSKINGINIKYITTTEKETLDVLSNNHIDLIILNCFEAGNIDLIIKINKINYIRKPNILVITENVDLMYKIKKKFNNLEIIYKSSQMKKLYNKMEEIISKISYLHEENTIQNYVTKELMKIGYDFRYKGSKYIYEAILYIYQNNNFDMLDNLEKNVYFHIANKYNKTINNIKTNIIKATNNIYNYKEEKELKKYFLIDIKITPKFVISNILNQINMLA